MKTLMLTAALVAAFAVPATAERVTCERMADLVLQNEARWEAFYAGHVAGVMDLYGGLLGFVRDERAECVGGLLSGGGFAAVALEHLAECVERGEGDAFGAVLAAANEECGG